MTNARAASAQLFSNVQLAAEPDVSGAFVNFKIPLGPANAAVADMAIPAISVHLVGVARLPAFQFVYHLRDPHPC